MAAILKNTRKTHAFTERSGPVFRRTLFLFGFRVKGFGTTWEGVGRDGQSPNRASGNLLIGCLDYVPVLSREQLGEYSPYVTLVSYCPCFAIQSH